MSRVELKTSQVYKAQKELDQMLWGVNDCEQAIDFIIKSSENSLPHEIAGILSLVQYRLEKIYKTYGSEVQSLINFTLKNSVER